MRNLDELFAFMCTHGTMINVPVNTKGYDAVTKKEQIPQVVPPAAPKQQGGVVNLNAHRQQQEESALETLRRCAQITRAPSKRYPCGIESIDSIFESFGERGFLPGIYLLVADPGGGKSSFALQVQHAMVYNGHLAAYFAFEGKDNIYTAARRIGLTDEANAKFLPAIMDKADGVDASSESICRFMRRVASENPTGKPAVFVVDSVANMNDGGVKGQREAIEALAETVEETKSIVFLIAHVSKETRGKKHKQKRIQGPAKLENLCDVRIDFIDDSTPQDTSYGYRRMTLDTSSKNRHGRPGEFTDFILTARGFEFPLLAEAELLDDNEEK